MQPATLIASRLVKAGHGEDFDRWAERLDDAVRASPGHRATIRLEQPGGLVHFIQRFDGAEAMERWTDSPERRALTAEADDFSVGLRQTACGDRVAAKLPSEAAAPKWKTCVATWTAVFPLLLALSAAVRLLPFELPQPVQLAITSLVMTVALTWFILPQVRKVLRPWLLGGDDGRLRRDG